MKTKTETHELIASIIQNPPIVNYMSQEKIQLVERMIKWAKKYQIIKPLSRIEGGKKSFEKNFKEGIQQCTQQDFLNACIFSNHPKVSRKFNAFFAFCTQGKKAEILFSWLYEIKDEKYHCLLKRALQSYHPIKNISLLQYAYIKRNTVFIKEIGAQFTLSAAAINKYFYTIGIRPENKKSSILQNTKKKRRLSKKKSEQTSTQRKKPELETKDEYSILDKVERVYRLNCLEQIDLESFKDFFTRIDLFFNQREFLIACKWGSLEKDKKFIPLLTLDKSKLNILFTWLKLDEDTQPLLGEVLALRDPKKNQLLISTVSAHDFFKSYIEKFLAEDDLTPPLSPSPLSPVSPLPSLDTHHLLWDASLWPVTFPCNTMPPKFSNISHPNILSAFPQGLLISNSVGQGINDSGFQDLISSPNM